MDLNLIHNSMYPTALKFAKRFVSDNHYRMILQLVQHAEDGAILATDSARGIMIENMHGFNEEWLVNPHTLEFAKGKYPEFRKVFPDPKETPDLSLGATDIDKWVQLLKGLRAMTKSKSEVLTFRFIEDSLIAESKLGLTIRLPFSGVNPSFADEQIVLNTIYLLDAMELFAAMKTDSVRIHFFGEYKPALFDGVNGVRVIILPVRVR
jgi:hypothetical protein